MDFDSFQSDDSEQEQTELNTETQQGQDVLETQQPTTEGGQQIQNKEKQEFIADINSDDKKNKDCQIPMSPMQQNVMIKNQSYVCTPSDEEVQKSQQSLENLQKQENIPIQQELKQEVLDSQSNNNIVSKLEINELSQMKNDYEAIISKKDEQIQNLEQQKSELKEVNLQLEVQLNNLQGQNSQMEQNNSQLQSSIEQLKQNIEVIQNSYTQLQYNQNMLLQQLQFYQNKEQEQINEQINLAKLKQGAKDSISNWVNQQDEATSMVIQKINSQLGQVQINPIQKMQRESKFNIPQQQSSLNILNVNQIKQASSLTSSTKKVSLLQKLKIKLSNKYSDNPQSQSVSPSNTLQNLETPTSQNLILSQKLQTLNSNPNQNQDFQVLYSKKSSNKTSENKKDEIFKQEIIPQQYPQPFELQQMMESQIVDKILPSQFQQQNEFFDLEQISKPNPQNQDEQQNGTSEQNLDQNPYHIKSDFNQPKTAYFTNQNQQDQNQGQYQQDNQFYNQQLQNQNQVMNDNYQGQYQQPYYQNPQQNFTFARQFNNQNTENVNPNQFINQQNIQQQPFSFKQQVVDNNQYFQNGFNQMDNNQNKSGNYNNQFNQYPQQQTINQQNQGMNQQQQFGSNQKILNEDNQGNEINPDTNNQQGGVQNDSGNNQNQLENNQYFQTGQKNNPGNQIQYFGNNQQVGSKNNSGDQKQYFGNNFQQGVIQQAVGLQNSPGNQVQYFGNNFQQGNNQQVGSKNNSGNQIKYFGNNAQPQKQMINQGFQNNQQQQQDVNQQSNGQNNKSGNYKNQFSNNSQGNNLQMGQPQQAYNNAQFQNNPQNINQWQQQQFKIAQTNFGYDFKQDNSTIDTKNINFTQQQYRFAQNPQFQS